MSRPLRAKFQRLKRLSGSFEKEAELEVDFNPTEFTFAKGAQIAEIAIPGLDMPILQFVRGQTETLSLDLFFDSTDTGMDDSAVPVTECTDRFYQLIKIDPETHAPPVCRFVWGQAGFPGSKLTGRWASQNRQNGFQCIVESVRQRFTLFSPLGVPLRATLTVALREYRTLQQQVQEIRFRSSDRTRTHVVQRGDTLSRLAAQAYDDPSRWRAIAEHNGIIDPLDLQPGVVLEIPPLS